MLKEYLIKVFKKLGKQGLGVIDVLVAFGLVSIIALALAAVINNAGKQQRGVQAKDQQREVTFEVRNLLADGTACAFTFAGVNPAAPNPTVTALKDNFDVAQYLINTPDKSGLLQFKEFKLVNWNPALNKADLAIKLEKIGDTGTVREIKADLISLRMNITAGTVSSCASLGGNGVDLWKVSPSTPTSIFYNDGNVGIGIDDPVYKFTIHDNSADVVLGIVNPGHPNPATIRYAQSRVYNFMGAANSGGPGYTLINARGVLGAANSLLAYDSLGSHSFWGAFNSGTGIHKAAVIGAYAAENFSLTGAGSDIFFSTAPIGAVSTIQRVTIKSDGNLVVGSAVNNGGVIVYGPILPGAANAFALGSAANPFSDIYVVNVPAPSDARLKQNIKPLNLGLDFITELRPVSYFWKSGNDKTEHYGLIAQATKLVFDNYKKKSGQKPSEAIVTYDAGADRFGIRYSELIAPLIMAIQELHQIVKKYLAFNNQELSGLKTEILKLREENTAIKNYICRQDSTSNFCKKPDPL